MHNPIKNVREVSIMAIWPKKTQKIECFLSFVYWNPVRKKEIGVPEGIEARMMDYNPLLADEVIGQGKTTGDEGNIHIVSTAEHEKKPDVFFELLTGGKYIELETNRLVSQNQRNTGQHYLLLPQKWSSKKRYAVDYRAGYFRNFSGARIGTAEFPLTFRLWIDCFLQFIYWNQVKQQYMGLPAGITVEALDYDPLAHLEIPIVGPMGSQLDADDPLGHGLTDEEGKAYLRILYKDEAKPDIYFKYSIPNDMPNRIDLASNELKGDPVPGERILFSFMDPTAIERPMGSKMPRAEGATLPLPREWNTRQRYALEDPARKGYWDDFAASRIGIAANPYVFDIFQEVPKFTTGNKIDYLIDGNAALASITNALENATKSIHFEVMLFFNDEIGNRLKDLLIRKAKEGVEVRLMVDVNTTGSSHSLITMKKIWIKYLVDMADEERARLLKKLDAEMEAEKQRGNTEKMRKEFNDTPNLTFKDTSFPYVQILPAKLPPGIPDFYRELSPMPFFTIARTDHRKIIIVDGKIGFLGGMNVGGEYFYENPFDPGKDAEEEAKTAASEKWIKWHDCFCEIRGPAVRELQKLYRERWVAEGGDPFPIGPHDLGIGTDPDHPYFPRIDAEPEDVPLKIISTTPAVRFHIHEEYLALIDNAKKEIYIENPYLSTYEIVDHLVRAAKRGVRVHYIFPDEHNDSLDFLYSARMVYGDMLDAGIHIYEYRNHMTHAKVAVIDDDITVIGSANFNHSAMFNHFESNVIIKNETVAENFRRDFFIRDIKNSRKIKKEDLAGLMPVSPAAYAWLKLIVFKYF
jgi:phosphatidylserine/phosphatidylglycerophosphate/cardiolipin synthase-like enzyme